jgi:hypothetical protein
MKYLILFCVGLTFSINGYAQTTSLVIKYDFKDYLGICYEDTFHILYTTDSSDQWLFERSFHCHKGFSWYDTISPVPAGSIRLKITLDSIAFFESVYRVQKGKLNEYEVTIDRQYQKSKGAPFVSEDYIQGYFRIGANFGDFISRYNNPKAVSFYSGFFKGIMISKRFGISNGFGLNYESIGFRSPLTSQTNHYNYWSFGLCPSVRFAPYTYENRNKLKRNTYIDVSVGYYFPLKFTFTENEVGGKSKTVYKGLHNYQDVRINSSITIGQLALFGSYRLNDIVKAKRFDDLQLPPLMIGLGITNQL